MNTERDHILTRKYGGKGITGWIQPTCSCGWEGRKEYAFDDYQRTNVKENESDHIRIIWKKKENCCDYGRKICAVKE